MKILLLGATGRTGKRVLEIALGMGMEVNCLVRMAYRIEEQEGLKVFEGDVLNPNDMDKAINGCECVVNVLNISRTSDFPWAKLRTSKRFLSDAMEVILKVAGQRNVKRIVHCSAWGTLESKKDIPVWFKWVIDFSNVGVTYRDHERAEILLENSDLDWTMVRPTGLTNSVREQNVKETLEETPKPSLTISRLSLANYLLNSIGNQELYRKKVTVSKG